MALETKAERVFLELLATLTDQGRDVSPSVSNTHAPSAAPFYQSF
jgi:hypothetical protein